MKTLFRSLLFSGMMVALLTAGNYCQLYAGEATARLRELLPVMTAADPSNAEQVKKMGEAQVTWMNLCLQEATAPGKEALRDEVNTAMIQALSENWKPETKAWLLHLLAWTGTDKEVAAIAGYVTSPETKIADEAARALSLIRTQKSLAALAAVAVKENSGVKQPAGAAIADTKTSRRVGRETEMPMAIPYITDREVEKWLAGYDQLSVDDQARTLAGLTVRGNRQYLPYAKKGLMSDNDDLAFAALLAVGKLGTPQDILELAKYLVPGPRRDLTILVMTRYPGTELNRSLVDLLNKSKDDSIFLGLCRVLTNRNVQQAFAPLISRANKPECPARLELLQMAENVARKQDVAEFVGPLLFFPASGDRDKAEQIIARLTKGDAALVIAKINNENAGVLVPAIGRIGGPDALKLVESLLKGDAASVTVAVKSLCNWPDATVAHKLLEIAENEAYLPGQKIQSLRAFARVITLPDDQIGIKISNGEKLTLLQKGMSLATRKEEKELVLSRIGAVRDPKSVEYLLKFIDKNETREAACKAITALAHHDYLRKESPALFSQALDAVIANVKDTGTLDSAKRYKQALKERTKN